MDLTSPHTHLQCTQVANFSTRGLSQALPYVREGTHKALGESSGPKMLHELSMIIPITCSVGVCIMGRYESQGEMKFVQLQKITPRKLTCSSFS